MPRCVTDFFSPELSTSNRATIGGTNTDASGQGSCTVLIAAERIKRLIRHIPSFTEQISTAWVLGFKPRFWLLGTEPREAALRLLG